MKRMVAIVAALACLGGGNNVCAKELLPWQTENLDISTPGIYSVRIDDRSIIFEVPADSVIEASRALVVITRGDKYEEWLTMRGEYDKGCFGMSGNFYPLGIPLFGSYAQFSILAKVHVKTTPAQRNLPGIYDRNRGDFSKPEELFENLNRTAYFPDRTTPIEKLVINNRKWYRHFSNSSLYPDALRESLATGLASDRYLEITIDYYPVPYPENRHPTFPAEDKRPDWMNKAVRYKEQVINSIRITKEEGNNEPDLYEVEIVPPEPLATEPN